MRLLTHSIAGRYGAPTAPPEKSRHVAILAALRARDAAGVRRMVAEDIRISHGLLHKICAASLIEAELPPEGASADS